MKITDLKEIARAANRGDWHPGCLLSDDTSCECAYIFDGGHAGAVGRVHIDNGLRISEGGNDAPAPELAKANLRHITTFDPPTVLRLLQALEQHGQTDL